MFFLRALLEFNLASLEDAVSEPSVNPRFFLPAFFYDLFTSFFGIFPFRAILFLLFPNFGFFDFFDEDALAFAISPIVSNSAFGLRNRIHSAEPTLVPVFLSPLPSLAPYQFLF